MKYFIILLTIFIIGTASAQVYPDYKVPVPEIVVLNHSCMYGNVRQILQSVAGTADPASAQFTNVVSDANNNLYFTGFADFTTTPPTNPNYPYAGPEITLGSNTSSPVTLTRLTGYKYFLARYNPDGKLQWVNFFSEQPEKLLWSESEQKLFVLFVATGNGIGVNGTLFPLDSAYQGNEHIIFTFEPSGGIFQNIYKNRYTHDFLLTNGKPVLIYRRQLTNTLFETRYGFFENNTVTKWQSPTTGVSDAIHQLVFNPYDNSFWFLNNLGDKYYRLLIQNNPDSLIHENIPRTLNREVGMPIQNIKKIDKFHFLPDGGFIGEYYTLYQVPGINQKVLRLVRIDASGNVVWRSEFSPQNEMWHKVIVETTGDVWLDLPSTFYYDKFKAVTAGKEYTINPYGNVGILVSPLLKLDGSTGDIKNAYINGYANVNYSMEISLATNMQLLHITSDNQLVSTPQIGAVAYYPDAAGNFKPYYTTCSNNILPSQFMWVSFDLNNLLAFKREELDEESIYPTSVSTTIIPQLSVYPNPSQHEFTLISGNDQVFELYDMTGKLVDMMRVEKDQPYVYQHQLPKGMYLLHRKEKSMKIKIVVQ